MNAHRLAESLVLLFLLPISVSHGGQPAAEETTSVTRHTARIGGENIDYTATAGSTCSTNEEGKPLANLFYVAYVRDRVEQPSRRPVVFSLSGGPGSAPVGMHLGFTGPRRLVFDDEGLMPGEPSRLEDNEDSILDVADIVYIDPDVPDSRCLVSNRREVLEDIESISRFMETWAARNGRGDSPKLLIGEGYGVARAAGLAAHLQDRMALNGIVLVSMGDLGFEIDASTRYAVSLPFYTATAWYHRMLPVDLQVKPLRDVLKESETLAMGAYLSVLSKGSTMPPENELAEQVSRYTGLSLETVLQQDLRIDRDRFRTELLREKGGTVGLFDSRYEGVDKPAAGATDRYDPALQAWNEAFRPAFTSYLRHELKLETDIDHARSWPPPTNRRAGELLREALTRNPSLKVLVLEGFFNGATDYLEAQYTLAHLDPGGELDDRIALELYESGYMVYIRTADRTKAKKDVAAFIQATSVR